MLTPKPPARPVLAASAASAVPSPKAAPPLPQAAWAATVYLAHSATRQQEAKQAQEVEQEGLVASDAQVRVAKLVREAKREVLEYLGHLDALERAAKLVQAQEALEVSVELVPSREAMLQLLLEV